MKKLNIVGDLRDLILIFQIVLWEKFFFQKLKFISNVRLINVFSSFWCLILPWMMMSAKFLLGVLCNDWCLKIDQKCTDCPNLIKQTSLINRKYILQDFECLDSAYCLLNMYSHICDFLSLFYLIFCKLTLVIKESRYIQSTSKRLKEVIYNKTSISHYIVSSFKQWENSRLFSDFLVWYASSIQLRYKSNTTWRCNIYPTVL